MTDPVDRVLGSIAAARALREEEEMKAYAEHLENRRPALSLAQIGDLLRKRKVENAAARDAREARTLHADGKRDEAAATPTAVIPPGVAAVASATPRSASRPAFYSVADANETEFLCRIAREPKLAESFIAARTPIVNVREALAQRAVDAQTRRDHEAIARKKAIAASWNEAVAKVSAENTGNRS
jgi:hypothetical protein